ncbi:MAG: transposase [Planctomycetes bacterium]|nr:transposase [Planctomycetota bacterium]
MDATGLESRHISPYFLRRKGRTKRTTPFPRLAVLCEHSSHMFPAALARAGPGNESPLLPPLVRQAVGRLRIHTLYADSAYDSEAHHRLCREQLGIANTVIPINDRGRPWALPRTPYRLQMKREFPQQQAGQRWHVESAISQLKRRLGACLTARNEVSRHGESYVRVLTHNLMIL